MIDGKGTPDFRVSYSILIKKQPGGTGIAVPAEIRAYEGERAGFKRTR